MVNAAGKEPTRYHSEALGALVRDISKLEAQIQEERHKEKERKKEQEKKKKEEESEDKD